MFICQECQKPSHSREKPVQKVVQQRPRAYKYYDSEGRMKKSVGWEIAKEIVICQECAGNKFEPPKERLQMETSPRICSISKSPNDFIPREMCPECKERSIEIKVIPVHLIEVDGLEIEVRFAEIGKCRLCNRKSLTDRESRRWDGIIKKAKRFAKNKK